MRLIVPHTGIASLAGATLLTVSAWSGAIAQVATLAEPGTEAEATPPAIAQEVDAEEALLEFAACMRENGVDMDDPGFGVDGGRLGFGRGDGETTFDQQSSEFVSAMEACGDMLESLRPELDPAEQAERAEQRLEMARCLRESGWDVADPDPDQGAGGPLRGGGLDVSDPRLREDVSACQADLGIELPAGPGGAPPA